MAAFPRSDIAAKGYRLEPATVSAACSARTAASNETERSMWVTGRMARRWYGMRGWWLLSVCLLAAAGTACGDSDDGDGPQMVTAIGLFEFQLPESWSVIVPTITEDELVPVLSVGTDGLPVEERVGVILFDGSEWATTEEAAAEWSERSSVALDFEAFEEDRHAGLRDEFTVTTGDGEAAAVSIINILS